jgi:outer membrane immunogenic protein
VKWILIAAAMVLATSGEAIAADLPPPGLPSPQSSVFYNWTGFYVGINAGYGTGTSNWPDGPLGSTGGFPTSGFLAGGTVGANYQIGQYVFGIEGDDGWSNLRGNSGSTCGGIAAVVPPTVSCQTQSDWLGTVRGRVGYAFDCILVYGTAGAAFDNVQTGLNPPSSSTARSKRAGPSAPVSKWPSHKIGQPKRNICSLTCRTLAAQPRPTAEAPQGPL